MPRSSGDSEVARYEDDYSPENMARCPGFRQVEVRGYHYLARCELSHPHREMVKVGAGYRTRVPLYGWVDNLKTERELQRWVPRAGANEETDEQADAWGKELLKQLKHERMGGKDGTADAD